MSQDHRLPFTLSGRLVAIPSMLIAISAMIGALALPAATAQADTACAPVPPFPGAGSFKDNNSQPNGIDNPYFPLEPGTVFTYSGKEGAQTTETEVEVTHTVHLIHGLPGGDVPTVEVMDDVTIDGTPAEHTLDWYGQDKQGNVWYFGEETKVLPGGDTSGSWEAGQNGALPGFIMKAHPKKGDRYMQEFAPNAGAEDFARVLGFVARRTVPHGSFTHVLKTGEGSCSEKPAGEIVEHKFYARGVGNIKTKSLDGEEVEQLVTVTKPGNPGN